MAGFRTAVKRYSSMGSLPATICGAKATFQIPSGYTKLNSAGNVLYFFVNVNANAGGYGNYDGGIYKQDNTWYAFIMGNGSQGWNSKPISSPEGKSVEVQLLARKIITTTPATYELVLYLDGVKTLSVTDTGNMIKSIYEDVIAKTTAEITLVPKDDIWRYFNTENGYGQSYIKTASFSNAYPVNRDGPAIREDLLL